MKKLFWTLKLFSGVAFVISLLCLFATLEFLPLTLFFGFFYILFGMCENVYTNKGEAKQ